MSWPVSNLVLRFDQSPAYRRFLTVLFGISFWMLASSACMLPLKIMGILALICYGWIQIRSARPTGRMLNLMHQSDQWFYAYEGKTQWMEVDASLFMYNPFFLF